MLKLLFILLLIPSVNAIDVSISNNILTINGEFSSIINIYYEDNSALIDVIDFTKQCGNIICKGSYSYDLSRINLNLNESYYFNVYDYSEKKTKRFNFGFRGTTSVIGKGLYEICSYNDECASGNCVGPEYHCCPIDRECYFNNKCYDVGEFTSNKEYVCSNLNKFETCEDYCSEQGLRCENGGCVLAKAAYKAVVEETPSGEIAERVDPCEGEGVPCKYGWWGTCIGKLFLPVWRCDGECVNGKCAKTLQKPVEEEISDFDYTLLIECVTNCDKDKCVDENALQQYCLNCIDPTCRYNEENAERLAFLNMAEERDVTVRITADDEFIFYLNGVEKLRGNKWTNLYEKDIRMNDGDIVLIKVKDNGGNKWIVFEAFDKQTGELIFNSEAVNPITLDKGYAPEWVVYPVYTNWDVRDYVIELNLFYNLNNFRYKGKVIPWRTTYDNKGNFDESYNLLYNEKGFSKVKNQLKNPNTEFVWGAYYYNYKDMLKNPEKMSQFYVGRKIKFPEK